MACPNYKKLRQECETHRRQLSEFHLMKIPNWQRHDETVCLVRGKQKAIVEAQELMDWHSTNCEECKRSASPPMKLVYGEIRVAVTTLGTEPSSPRPSGS